MNLPAERRKKQIIGLAILLVNLFVASYFVAVFLAPAKGHPWLTPGKATDGHHQIIESCKTCHTPFQPVQNQVCLDCHAKELEAVDDSHPESKFQDPRNAALIEKMDATLCITCHNEHDPKRTRSFGVTLADDFCIECHRTVGDDLKSHKGMAFNSCASAGCHNYHDNQALYEDFLIKHVDDEDNKAEAKVRTKTPSGDNPKALAAAQHDGKDKASQTILNDWATTAHAKAGINCNDCHMGKGKKKAWEDRPAIAVCKSCHAAEYATFSSGKHGMRLAQKLSPKIEARLPLKIEDPELTCNSCHEAHRYEARLAASEACIGCHDDDHTKSYSGSPHHLLWLNESAGKAAPGTGVSCATCHMPRLENDAGESFVDHNQNHNFQPNEKMVRTVCLNCHGLEFSLKALADPVQIRENFRSKPDFDLKTLDMARERK